MQYPQVFLGLTGCQRDPQDLGRHIGEGGRVASAEVDR